MNAPKLTPQQWEEIGPELYAALEEMLLQFGIRGGNGTCQKARAALAKARGETP